VRVVSPGVRAVDGQTMGSSPEPPPPPDVMPPVPSGSPPLPPVPGSTSPPVAPLPGTPPPPGAPPAPGTPPVSPAGAPPVFDTSSSAAFEPQAPQNDRVNRSFHEGRTKRRVMMARGTISARDRVGEGTFLSPHARVPPRSPHADGARTR